MRRFVLAVLAAVALLGTTSDALPACCYFSALEKDVNQPGQRAFLTWDPVEKVESFTVQPRFEGNADDFGMVIPTPTQPKLAEVDRDFFKSLAVFTILRPMNVRKFKGGWGKRMGGPATGGMGGGGLRVRESTRVRVLEYGVVGSLDYKILEATRAKDLFDWLDANHYAYKGDVETLDFYIRKGWYFTVMKIDPKQMKRAPDGSYTGEVTPTRFSFESDRLVYPLRITRISVKDTTDALFYVQAPQKMDLDEDLSYEFGYQQMWTTAYAMADWELCNDAEKAWWEHVGDDAPQIRQDVVAWKKRNPGRLLTTLEWSRRLTGDDIALLNGVRKFDREAPDEDVRKLAKLVGTLRAGQFVTKLRHVFHRDEMTDDLVFVEARYKGRRDDVEHIEILPTSPP